jgi:type II secretory pathway pseudopilin PulG
VVVVLAVLLAAGLTAVQKARASARRAESLNDIRQLMGGIHQYAAAKNGELPGWCPEGDRLRNTGCIKSSPIGEARLVLNPPVRFFGDPERGGYRAYNLIASVTDPSFAYHPTSEANCGTASYAANHQAFVGPARRFPGGQPDGASNTVSLAEHYARCGQRRDGTAATNFVCGLVRSARDTYPGGPEIGNERERPASFAHAFYGDVVPVRFTTESLQPAATGSVFGATFQVRPSVPDCDPTVPQTPHPGGMITGLMDGSGRVLRGGMAPHVFWSAVTPAGGETVALD